METSEKLDKLAELQGQVAVIQAHFTEMRAQILTPEIQKALADIDSELNTSLSALQQSISQITEEIKQDILKGKATVKGKTMTAIWVKGRVSWDVKALDGYALAHPEMNALRKEGEPSVTIRKI